VEGRVINQPQHKGSIPMHRLLSQFFAFCLFTASVPGPVLAHEGHKVAAEGTGVVNSIDVAKHSINVSHAPIRALKWPSMTMDFPVDPEVDLSNVKPGMKINFELVNTETGEIEIHELHPVAGK
jgi:Cu(I)/Ag(I) efflux system protein CusF